MAFRAVFCARLKNTVDFSPSEKRVFKSALWHINACKMKLIGQKRGKPLKILLPLDKNLTLFSQKPCLVLPKRSFTSFKKLFRFSRRSF